MRGKNYEIGGAACLSCGINDVLDDLETYIEDNEETDKKRTAAQLLRPCPYCGNCSPLLFQQYDLFFVRCEQCKVIGGISRSIDKSVEAWNERKGGDLG